MVRRAFAGEQKRHGLNLVHVAPGNAGRQRIAVPGSQLGAGLLDRPGDHRQPVLEERTAGARRETHVGQPGVGVFGEIAGVARHQPLQRLRRLGRESQHVQGPLHRRRGRRGSLRCLFEDDVGVGASDPQRIDPGPSRQLPWRPGAGLGVHVERRVLKVDRRIGARVVQARRQGLVLQGRHGLDQADDAGGRLQVAHVGLHRA